MTRIYNELQHVVRAQQQRQQELEMQVQLLEMQVRKGEMQQQQQQEGGKEEAVRGDVTTAEKSPVQESREQRLREGEDKSQQQQLVQRLTSLLNDEQVYHSSHPPFTLFSLSLSPSFHALAHCHIPLAH